MSGPWEDFKSAEASGPWADFAETASADQPPAEKPTTVGQDLMKLGGQGVDYALRGLDYAGGLVRTGAADTFLDADTITADDWQRALKGQAPDSNEILDRAGVGEGGLLSDLAPGMYSETGQGLKLQKGGALDPSARGALGLALDIGTDPLTYATLGISAVGKAGKAGKAANLALKPASNLMESGGKAMYKSGLKRIDQEAAKYGKEPVSDVLMKYDVAGSANAIYDKMKGLSSKLTEQQKGLLQQADEAGAYVDMTQAMKPADEVIEKYRFNRNPEARTAVEDISKTAEEYRKLDTLPDGVQGPLPRIGVQQANDFKTSIYNKIPKGSWAETSSGLDPIFIEGRKQQARGLKEGVEAAVDSIGKGDELRGINDELGRLLSTGDKQWLEAIKEQNKPIFSSVDGGLLGLALSDPGKAAVLATKKAADAAKMTGPRTVGGRALNKMGKSEAGTIWDILLRQGMIEKNRSEPGDASE